MIVKLCDKTRKNLIFLRDGVRAAHEKHKTVFSMSCFWDTDSDGNYCDSAPCGTAVCLLGHTILIPELAVQHQYESDFFSSPEFWINHSSKIFPSLHSDGRHGEALLFEFLFESQWPNCIDKAIERINWLLDLKDPMLYMESK